MALTKAQKLRKLIRNDLQEQLNMQKKNGKYFADLVDDYMYLLELKHRLQEDVKENGLRITVTGGNGFKSEKPNESVQNLLKVTSQMLKILSDLGLQEPTIKPSNSNDDYC